MSRKRKIMTRSEAKALGLHKYFTGKPCPHAHKELRIVSDAKCTACLRLKERKRHHQQRITGKSKKARTDRMRKWKRKKPERIKSYARNSLHSAVKIGLIKKKRCRVCNKKNVHGHHEDYSKPLTVNWLCVKCHHLRHNPHLTAEKEKRG